MNREIFDELVGFAGDIEHILLHTISLETFSMLNLCICDLFYANYAGNPGPSATKSLLLAFTLGLKNAVESWVMNALESMAVKIRHCCVFCVNLSTPTCKIRFLENDLLRLG